MQRIDKILVPLDGALPSEHALAFAVDLAESLGATVHLVSAYQVPALGFPVAAYAITAQILKSIFDPAQELLENACAKYRDRNVELTTRLGQGDPREVILAEARNVHAQLIVMGTHGRTGVARALIGSVTEGVLRATNVPVLTVH